MKTDVHHHFIPLFYHDALPKSGQDVSGLPVWTPQRSLDMMDRAHIDRAFLSLPPRGVWFGDNEEARQLSRKCNEYAASLKKENSGRFGGLAVLPLPDVRGALDELAYSLDTLRLDGVILFSNVNGSYVGDPEFDPVLTELDRRNSQVLLHANDVPSGDENVALYPWAEAPIDIARAVIRLLLNDQFTRFPGIKWTLADGGGIVPYLADRISRAHYTDGRRLRWLRIARDLFLRRNGGLITAQSLNYDSVGTHDPAVRAALERLVPEEKIRFGSDFPFREE